MSFNLNSLWLDWRAKVPDGVPNPSNAYHLVLLKELCLKQGIDTKTTDSVILFLEKKVDDEDVIKYKQDGESKEMKAGSAKTMDKEHPAKIEYDKLKGSDDEDEEEDKPEPMKIDANPFDKEDDEDKEGGEEKPSEEQIENEKDKRKFLKTTVDLLIQELKQTKTGAGAREMDKEQWVALKNFAEGKGPEIKQYEVSEQDIDDAIDLIKSSGKKGVMSFLQTKGAADPDSIRKGTEDNPGPGWNRDRKMVKSFLACGGLSAVTGKPLSIGTSNVDHRLSLENGGKDEPENWIWMETEMNMNKSSLTDEQLIERAKKALSVTDDEKRKKQLMNIIKNESKKFVTEHYKTLFELGGNGGITEDELKGMNYKEIKAVTYGWNKIYPKTSDLYINTYAAQKAGSRGAGGRGVALNKGDLIKNVIEQLSKKERVLTSEEIEALDGQLQEGIEDIKREAGK